MNHAKAVALASVLTAVTTAPAAADELEVSSQGEVGAEARIFLPGTEGDLGNVSGIARLYLELEYDDFELNLRGFGRHDGIDRKRSALFPEEAFLEYKNNPVRVRLGYQLLNWTATEAFHPADIINARYLDGNVQNPEKLGELMGAFRYKFLDGNVEAYVMPLFTSPVFPSEDSRFRFGPLGVALGETLVLDRDGTLEDDPWFLQWGARVQQSIFGADVSLHFIRHIDRSLPLVTLTDDGNGGLTPGLVFQALTQVGGTYQQVWGPIIVKVEAAYRDFENPTESEREMLPPEPLFSVPDRDHTLVAVGLEYGLPHDDGESTFLLEGQYAIGFPDEEEAPGQLLLFGSDVLAGYRYAFNDVDDKTITASVIIDIEEPEQIFGNVAYQQRIGEEWRGELGFRLINFPAADPNNPQGPENLDDANYFYTSLIRFF